MGGSRDNQNPSVDAPAVVETGRDSRKASRWVSRHGFNQWVPEPEEGIPAWKKYLLVVLVVAVALWLYNYKAKKTIVKKPIEAATTPAARSDIPSKSTPSATVDPGNGNVAPASARSAVSTEGLPRQSYRVEPRDPMVALQEMKLEIEAYNSEIESSRQRLENLNYAIEEQRRSMDDALGNGDTARYNVILPSYNKNLREYNEQSAQHQRLVMERRDLLLEADGIIEERTRRQAR